MYLPRRRCAKYPADSMQDHDQRTSEGRIPQTIRFGCFYACIKCPACWRNYRPDRHRVFPVSVSISKEPANRAPSLTCDYVGRKAAMVFTTLMIVIGGILATASHGVTIDGMFWMLTVSRGIIGFGTCMNFSTLT